MAESCTGGGLAKALTEIPGSSQWFDRAFITYSNEAKMDMLQVSSKLLKKFGAVSKEVAEAMALGAIRQSKAHVSAAITGIAGPTGGSPEKPVGTVWISWAGQQKITSSQSYHFSGDRHAIREKAISEALKGL